MKPILIAAALLSTAAAPANVDSVDSVSLALARGLAAEASGDPRAMLGAAQNLDALGARPDADQPDLAGRWRDLAKRRGFKDRSPWRGRALGPAYRQGKLLPGAALATEQVFLAGQKAMVALVPEPGRSLSIRIAGPDKEICERVAAPPRATCAWLPLFTTRVKISIANRGQAAADYYLVSN
jgi:hypothetical protein